jgi:hypothetical protein
MNENDARKLKAGDRVIWRNQADHPTAPGRVTRGRVVERSRTCVIFRFDGDEECSYLDPRDCECISVSAMADDYGREPEID